MIINHDRRWLIISPPKTGSSTLKKLLVDHGHSKTTCSYTGYQHDTDVPADCRDYVVFVTVRNPYERAISLWWHRLWDICNESISQQPEYALQDATDFVGEYPFSQFVDWARTVETPFFSWPCIRWFRYVPAYRTLRLESLPLDLRRATLWQSGHPIPHENRTDHAPARSYYTADLQRAIRRLYRGDFDAFSYSENLP